MKYGLVHSRKDEILPSDKEAFETIWKEAKAGSIEAQLFLERSVAANRLLVSRNKTQREKIGDAALLGMCILTLMEFLVGVIYHYGIFRNGPDISLEYMLRVGLVISVIACCFAVIDFRKGRV